MGLMSKRGLPYIIFNAVARYQYSLADTIGIQTPGNQIFFKDYVFNRSKRVEVLHNWLSDIRVSKCTISLANTKLAGRKIFVYAGNMGVAQKVSIFLDLAELLRDRLDVGFVFVGRGTEFVKISEEAMLRRLNNVLFYDEIHPDEIAGLYAQCAVGLVALDPRHKSHNIPGKFLTYMQAGLPVLASINFNNDLIEIIQENNVGRVSVGGNQEALELDARDLLSLLDVDHAIKDRCRNLYLKFFTPELAARQIIEALGDKLK
jgi:glycosyltransferase involved in cell wall biosynthesis